MIAVNNMKKINNIKDRIIIETNLKSNLSSINLSRLLGEELILLIDERITIPLNNSFDTGKKVN